MTKLTRLSTLSALLLSLLAIPSTNTLDFSVSNINCTELDWTATLTQTEWSVASYFELFFISTQGSQNYTLLYSALNGGAFPTLGAYSKTTLFGDTALSGGYRIGIGLTDVNGNILTTTNTGMGTVQVTAIDDRSFTFGDCSRSTSAGVGVAGQSSTVSSAAGSTSSVASATPSSASSAAATTFSTRTVASSTVAVSSSTSTSATAAPISTISTSTTTTSQPSSTAHSGVNKGAIAGAVVGTLLLVLLSIFFLRWCTSRRRTRRLSQAVHRMASLRPLSLCEKQVSSPKLNGSESPQSRHRVARVHAAGDTLEIAALARLSVASRRRSEGATPSIAGRAVYVSCSG